MTGGPASSNPSAPDASTRASRRLTLATVAMVGLGLLAFSQLGGIFDGDEGLHIVAAQLVQSGRLPFVEFFYWHQPLYLYVAAGWMSLVADGWRGLHALSALLTAGTALLIGGFVPHTAERAVWRRSTSPLAVVFFAGNVLVLKWGTIGHNYALCMLLSVAAFRLTTAAASRDSTVHAFGAGLCAGGATATSLLVAPLAPILAVWLFVQRRTSNRFRRLAAFVSGAPVAFMPLVVLVAQAPDRTMFGILTHHLFYRVPFDDPAALQFETLTGWIASPQAVLVVSLGAIGLASLYRLRRRLPVWSLDLSLCALVTCSLTMFIALAHPPPLTVYFVLTSPFAAILAAYGTTAIGRVPTQRRTAAAAAAIFAIGLAIPFYRERLWQSDWERVERFAAEVLRITPPDGEFYTTFSFVYVAARRAPPAGTENAWASEMSLPRERFVELGVLPMDDVTAAIRSGRYRSLVLLDNDPRVDSRKYPGRLPLDRYWTLRWRDQVSDAPLR